MAKPPAGSSLLFGALADSGRIKQRKNGSYRMVLKGVDEIDWFTDRPDRAEGTWKPQKLLRQWDQYFATSEPNAQATVEVGEQRELFTFEMFKPKIKSEKMMFSIKPISDSGEDKLANLQGVDMNDTSLFVDASAVSPGVNSNGSLNYMVGQIATDVWGLMGNDQNVEGLEYGRPINNKPSKQYPDGRNQKVSDEIFSAFEDGTIKLMAFPKFFGPPRINPNVYFQPLNPPTSALESEMSGMQSPQPLMTKPPAGASLLFGALADAGQIKQTKNGSFRMVLDGVDEIDWFTDRPNRVEGTWKQQKLLRKWDKYFATSEPNAQATVEEGEQRELLAFEMFKPHIKSGKMIFNIEPLTDSGEDKLMNLHGINMTKISLSVDASRVNSNGVLNYQVSQDLTDKWGQIGNFKDVPGLQYGNPYSGKKVSDEVFNAFKDGTIELIAFPHVFCITPGSQIPRPLPAPQLPAGNPCQPRPGSSQPDGLIGQDFFLLLDTPTRLY